MQPLDRWWKCYFYFRQKRCCLGIKTKMEAVFKETVDMRSEHFIDPYIFPFQKAWQQSIQPSLHIYHLYVTIRSKLSMQYDVKKSSFSSRELWKSVNHEMKHSPGFSTFYWLLRFVFRAGVKMHTRKLLSNTYHLIFFENCKNKNILVVKPA